MRSLPFFNKPFLSNNDPSTSPGIVNVYPSFAETKNDDGVRFMSVTDQHSANEYNWENPARDVVLEINETHTVLLCLETKGSSGFCQEKVVRSEERAVA